MDQITGNADARRSSHLGGINVTDIMNIGAGSVMFYNVQYGTPRLVGEVLPLLFLNLT